MNKEKQWKTDEYGRKYLESEIDHMGEKVKQRRYEDGGTDTMFGGPCGPLYTDKFGNS